MGPEGIRGRISKAIENFRGGPKPKPEETEQPVPMASAQQISDLFSLIEEVIDAKVLCINLSSGGIDLGISKTPKGKSAYIEVPSEDDTVIAVGLKTDGEHIERYERRRYSEEPQVIQNVTEAEIQKFIKSARKVKDPFLKA